MADEVKVYVVEFGDRPNYQLQWRVPITQKLRTKTTHVKRTSFARDRKVAERLAGELWGADWAGFSVQGSSHGNMAIAMTIGKPGDKVIFSSYAGDEIAVGDDEYLLLRENDILATY